MGSGPVLLRNPIFFVIYQGGGSGPPAPLWIRACKNKYILYLNMLWYEHILARYMHFKVSWIVVKPYSCHKAMPCLGTNRE